jgi:hypothetical protein
LRVGRALPPATLLRMDSTQLFLSLFISVIGTAYFVYGKKQTSVPFLVSGVLLMFFGYFVDSFWLTALIFAALTAAPFYFR